MWSYFDEEFFTGDLFLQNQSVLKNSRKFVLKNDEKEIEISALKIHKDVWNGLLVLKSLIKKEKDFSANKVA